MKRLIVLTALMALLASTLGCGALHQRRAEGPCEGPVARTRIPRLSLPWRRNANECGACGQPVMTTAPVCNACTGAAVGTDPITTGPIVTQPLYDSGTIYDGTPVYEGGTVVERMPVPVAGPEMNIVQP